MLNLIKMMWKYDVNSDQFKAELKKRNLENEVEQIKPHTSPTDLALRPTRIRYPFIDEVIFANLKKELAEHNLSESLNDIASIIKSYYTSKILIELNESSIEEFNSEFQALYKFMGKELSSIKFNGMKSREGVNIKHKGLIQFILHSCLRQLHNNPSGYHLIASNNLKHYKASSMLTSIESEAAYELFLYIQIRTQYKYKSNEKDIISGTLSNEFCELIHELLLIGGIVKENQTDAPAAFTRLRINRFMLPEPNRIALLKNDPEFLNFASVFPDAVFFQEIVDVKSDLAKKLKASHLKQ